MTEGAVASNGQKAFESTVILVVQSGLRPPGLAEGTLARSMRIFA